MVVVAILLTGTTIRMSAASRRTETEIMRYVGASNWTIRLPFHSGGHHRLADRLGALVPDAFGYRQRVRHRLAGEIRYMDSLCESAHGTGDIAFLVVGAILLSIIASTISLRR